MVRTRAMSSVRTLARAVAVAVSACCCACGPRAPKGEGAAPANGGTAGTSEPNRPAVRVTVNGRPIDEVDVAFALRKAAHGAATGAELEKQVLEGLIQQELWRQRAEELGLESDPGYRAQLRKHEVELDAARRNLLGRLLYRTEIFEKATVTEDAIVQYHTEHARELGADLHLEQLLFKGSDTEAKQALAALQAGTPFEAVAATHFPKLAKGAWDAGFMSWSDMPQEWRESAYRLEPGGVSGIIAGPGGRYWILRLVEKRPSDKGGLEFTRRAIEDLLREQRILELRAETNKRLRERARIEYLEAPKRAPRPAAPALNANPHGNAAQSPRPEVEGEVGVEED